MYDVIIVGAGPAGLTAGIYAGRFRLNTLIFEKVNPGGQIVFSPVIENFPGFPGGIETLPLIERFKKQVDELGIDIVMDKVVEIAQDAQKKPAFFTVNTPDKSYCARSLIIAAGAGAKKIGVPGENEFVGRGVSYCGTCDGPFFKNKDVLVIGGGDKAVGEAVFLTQYAKKVVLVHRRREFRASKILVEKAMANPKIEIVLDNILVGIEGKGRVEAAAIKNTSTGLSSVRECQGVFIFIGIKPNTGFLKNKLFLDETGFIITDYDMKTSVDGIYACGDCRKKSLYQVINACGEAAVACDSAHRYLLNL